jgi:hypothetical protein
MEAMVEGMADAGLAVVPGGHSVYYEDPETWNAAVLGFLHQQDFGQQDFGSRTEVSRRPDWRRP